MEQNKNLEINPPYTFNYYLARKPKILIDEKIVTIINGVGKTGHSHKK